MLPIACLGPLVSSVIAAAGLLAPAAGTPQPWVDLGNALPGSAGTPALAAEGSLIGGSNFTLTLTDVAPNTSAFLVLGDSQVNLPVAGGVLVPSPDVIVGPFDTGPSGSFEGTSKWLPSVAPGVQNYWQFWVVDPGAGGGFSASNALQSTTPTQVGGSFPDDWVYGGDCGSDPVIQVHAYNDDFYILRQSMCTNFEGPFLFLLFGEDEALLLDTGAGGVPVAATVNAIIADWLLAAGKPSIDLLVAHTHSHGDHIQGDSQFSGQPNTTVVGTSGPAVTSFFGFQQITDQVTYDLGDRVLDILAIPGHQNQSLAFYDRQTGVLLTGDSLYPGFIFVFNGWNTFRDSISRLRDFAETVPIAWVLGTHVEMKSTPFESYPYGTNNQPDERDLQLELKHLRELDEALDLLPTPTVEAHADFVITG